MGKRPEPSEQDRLWAARVLGAGAVGVLAQFAVDMPGGYLGVSDRITTFGAVYAGGLAVAVAAAAWAHLTGRRWAGMLTFATLSLSLGVFLAPVAFDPVLAGSVVLWNLYLVGRLLFPLTGGRFSGAGSATLEGWLALNRRATLHLLLVSIVLTVSVVGFRTGSRVPAQLVCLVLDTIVLVVTGRYLKRAWQTGSRASSVALLAVLAALLAVPNSGAVLAWLGAYQVVLAGILVGRSSLTADLLEFFFRRPAALVAISFALLIGAGTLFLSFPAASAGEEAIAPIDALFTSTSAVCVTGLIVLDTPSAFSTFGHAVIVLLIQVGGLNIMVLSAFAALLLGRGLGLRGEAALGEVLDLPVARTATQLARFIVSTTFAVEGLGALYLALAFSRTGLDTGEAVWRGVFHSISAFCNAGFALQSDSLLVFQHDPLTLVVVAALIIIGGIGFAVLSAAWAAGVRSPKRRPSVQVRLVLVSTAFLVLAGTLWVATAEWGRSLAGLTPIDKIANAFFQAVTPRTAGFNSVDLQLLQPSTVLLMIVLMFIGASPGGTGGGIKTTTAAVLLGAIPAISRGESRIVLFRRTVPLETVYRSAAIAAIAATVVFTATGALLATQPLGLESALFEVVSALGTVGLSLGATARLDAIGKAVIVMVMFIGRIGPLALALALGRAAAGRIAYPDARIMVG